MRDAAPQTIYLRDYEPFGFLITHTELYFALHPTKTRVRSRIEFTPNPKIAAPKFILDGENLTLLWAKIDGQEVAPEITAVGLTCAVPDGPFVWEAEVEINPSANAALEGLYMSNGMYCTQCEAQGFRKITYYPDRPDVMATFDVHVTGDLPVLLSNGNPQTQQKGFAHWQDPWPKPAYLFALVAGDLVAHPGSFTTQSGRVVELNIWVRAQDADKCTFAMEALIASMRWDEEVYGREYDLDVFNIVAVDDFNMGAMENKGLNIFNSSAVLASPETATDMNFERIEAIIAHEYFHNWTGNRITCRDWFQLCLKEGLTVFRDAQFTADMRSAAVKRIDDVVTLRSRQFREDNGPLSHPVRPESFVEINNFYTTTIYEKGAELIGMLKTLVGGEDYYNALDLYFTRHDGHAATIEDWLQVFEDTTGRDLSQFKRWYSDAGTPRVKVSEHFEGDTLTVTFEQSTPPTPGQDNKPPRVIPIAMGLLGEDGTELQPTTVFEMTEGQQSATFTGLKSKPVLSLLREFSAPIILEHTRSTSDLGFLMAHDSDPFNRWEAARQLARDILLKLINDDAPEDETYLDGLAELLRTQDLEPAFRALILRNPGQDELADTLHQLGQTPDPDQIWTALDTFQQIRAEALQDLLPKLYAAHQITAPYKPDAAQSGARALGNAVLNLITRLDGGKQAQMQFDTATNMTQQLAGFGALLRADKGQNATERFAKQWAHERLVMDKWFMLQVQCALPESCARIADRLTQHGDFNLKNPNRFRAVFGAMAANAAGFHQKSGAGYKLLADWLIKLDPINPQTTARMCASFETWPRYDAVRQDDIKKQLRRILGTPDLSRDTTEMVTRILG